MVLMALVLVAVAQTELAILAVFNLVTEARVSRSSAISQEVVLILVEMILALMDSTPGLSSHRMVYLVGQRFENSILSTNQWEPQPEIQYFRFRSSVCRSLESRRRSLDSRIR
jgi:hypothetical protein